jgi:hypothetical protein
MTAVLGFLKITMKKKQPISLAWHVRENLRDCTLFGKSELRVMDHIFLTLGSGHEWRNGALLPEDPESEYARQSPWRNPHHTQEEVWDAAWAELQKTPRTPMKYTVRYRPDNVLGACWLGFYLLTDEKTFKRMEAYETKTLMRRMKAFNKRLKAIPEEKRHHTSVFELEVECAIDSLLAPVTFYPFSSEQRFCKIASMPNNARLDYFQGALRVLNAIAQYTLTDDHPQHKALHEGAKRLLPILWDRFSGRFAQKRITRDKLVENFEHAHLIATTKRILTDFKVRTVESQRLVADWRTISPEEYCFFYRIDHRGMTEEQLELVVNHHRYKNLLRDYREYHEA